MSATRVFVVGAILLATWMSGSLPRANAAEMEPLTASQPSYIYKAVGERQLRVDMLYPDAWQVSDRRPCIVFFSGGGFKNGTTTQFESQAKYFAQRGLVTIRAEYRDSIRDQATVNICLHDALSAMRWVRQHAAQLGIDAHRIVASGGSAGGFLAAAVAATADLKVPGDDMSISPVPNALVLFNPVVDLVAAERPDLTNEPASLKDISPAYHLTSTYPPAVILIGSEDRFLGQIQSWRMRSSSASRWRSSFTQTSLTPSSTRTRTPARPPCVPISSCRASAI
jgi:acetyl esterase/lipase